jgi:DNA repair protein RecN (Recombination protein N)
VLAELRIRNFAIIDELQLNFAPGFSVLTGETGAGKSIIIDAVEQVLGERADVTTVRAGADRAIIEATFRLEQDRRAAIEPVLQREGLEGDDADFLLLGREIRLNGRSVARVNGRTVTLSLLRELTGDLVDIHGQSEHLSLLRVGTHVDLLDRYAELGQLRAQVSALVNQVRAVRHDLADLVDKERELAHRADLLQFQIGEIEAAALQRGEEEELLGERRRLANAEQLASLADEVLQVLEQGQGEAVAALDLLGVALRALERLARVDPALEPQLQTAESVNYQIEELVRVLRDYQEQIEYNPRRLQEVEERLALVRRLQRKYGQTISEILAYAEEAMQELDTITHSEERIVELQAEEERLLEELGTLVLELSLQRREAAQRLAAGIERELHDLHMEGARFGVSIKWREDSGGVPLPQPGTALAFQVSSSGVEQLENSDLDPEDIPRVAFDSSGVDYIEFLVSPNPGEPLKPLKKVASGGETSRLMLALKTVLSHADETPTLIFDEIDQGIGGQVGAMVGQKLWGLAAGVELGHLSHQVLCVTHLPQLAVFGDVHFSVEKHVEITELGERTVTRIRQLGGGSRVEEVARMLGGGGEAARRSAEEILGQVTDCKAQAQPHSAP